MMILYNSEFDGIDHSEYFSSLKERMSKDITGNIIQAPLKTNGAFLIGSKKGV